MKLWKLKPMPNHTLWEPWYDKAFGFVVRAETEQQAREIAAAEAGDETFKAWIDATCSTCDEVTTDGGPEIVLRDLWSA